ncbi:hypothetical protein D9V37_15665 [Nocardioides mangrovicus]|uniref:DUF461 domain-containing protein n=1 Tax=Nocardioides mangrovicus TaxID=2478913 RepID=A0A3L8NWS4_9ACTN|nr:hypothetical protein D9V37_15665 [Nocardioides mangrovicus]
MLARLSLLLAVPLVGACGFNAQTDAVYQPAVGSNARDSQVDVLGAVVVSSTPGRGRFIATLSNESQSHSDKLTGIQSSGSTEATLSGDISITATGDVNLAKATPITVTGSKIDAVKSNFVTFQLTFERAEPVTISVPVVTATGPYQGYGAASTLTPNDVATKGSQGAFGQ